MTISRAAIKANLVFALLLLSAVVPPGLQADARSDGERGIAEYRKGNLIVGMELLQKSAEAGYAPAQTTLAYILDAAEDDAAAFHWYQQAADQNDAEGLFGLGGMYAKGEGTEKDPRKAGELIERAARLDHPRSMRVYAHALEHGQLGFEAAPEKAAEWYLKAANPGDGASMKRLSQAYTLGQLGLQAGPGQAADWDKKLKQIE